MIVIRWIPFIGLYVAEVRCDRLFREFAGLAPECPISFSTRKFVWDRCWMLAEMGDLEATRLREASWDRIIAYWVTAFASALVGHVIAVRTTWTWVLHGL